MPSGEVGHRQLALLGSQGRVDRRRGVFEAYVRQAVRAKVSELR